MWLHPPPPPPAYLFSINFIGLPLLTQMLYWDRHPLRDSDDGGNTTHGLHQFTRTPAMARSLSSFVSLHDHKNVCFASVLDAFSDRPFT